MKLRNIYPSLNPDIPANKGNVDLTVKIEMDSEGVIQTIKEYIKEEVEKSVRDQLQDSGLYDLAAKVRGHDRYIEDLRESLRNKY